MFGSPDRDVLVTFAAAIEADRIAQQDNTQKRKRERGPAPMEKGEERSTKGAVKDARRASRTASASLWLHERLGLRDGR